MQGREGATRGPDDDVVKREGSELRKCAMEGYRLQSFGVAVSTS